MPSTATITAFYNFTANTKARASQVNTNFDTFRGHILPVSPTTATAIDNTYDLGSSEYRWRSLYLPATVGTITAASGGIAIGATFSSNFYTITSTPMVGSTLTITTIGRPVEFCFLPAHLAGSTYIGVNATNTTDSFAQFDLLRNGSTICGMTLHFPSGSSVNRSYTPTSVKFVDFPSAGTHVYSINARISGAANSANLFNVRPFLKELL